MSGSIGRSTAPFSDAERVDIRRFTGYSAYGAGAAGFAGWRFFKAYGVLEYRMTNLGPAELQVVRQYLSQLYSLEQAIFGASANLDTDEAAVWKHNRHEVADRTALYSKWRHELAGMLGVPAGPALGGGGFRIVV